MTLAAPAELPQTGIRPALPKFALPAGLGLPALVLLCATLFGALPFLRLLAAAFAPGWQFAPDAALAEITSRAAVNATLHTFETAGLSALGALLIGGTAAIRLAVTEVRGKRPLAFALVFSMMIAPASSTENCKPSTVTTGISALRRTWRSMVRRRLTPLARAVRT